jgi:hypothetical protein
MMGEFVDYFKFAAASFASMPPKAVRDIIDLCHKHKFPADMITT